MAKKQLDIFKTGPARWDRLQEENNQEYARPSSDMKLIFDRMRAGVNSISPYDPYANAPQLINSSLSDTNTPWGESAFDEGTANMEQFRRLGDIRAENQPWYSKLVNGVGKGAVLAATTALETAGLIYGAGQGIFASNGKSFLQDLWDNPITNALKNLNDAAEEFMPNYYTQAEMENPFSNIFTANFLGDKILKNMGFMVGAFYGGMPASKLIGGIGTRAVKRARNAALAERAGMARRVGELTTEYGDDVAGLERALAREGLTEAERGKRIREGFDKVKNIAKTTRATTQTVGALGSAINEGAIEAINNSKDWANLEIQKEEKRYQEELAGINDLYGEGRDGDAVRIAAAEKHEQVLAEIEKGRARMGNADLLLNIPVLMYSNIVQLGRLYSRGFDSTRRQMGSFWNGHKLAGSLAKGTLKSTKTKKGALARALMKSNTEGMEEYLQRAASDGSGQAVSASIDRFLRSGKSEDATNSANDFIAGFGKAIADNLGDPNAWEEYMIGALSSMVGMPVFGSQTKNSYIAKGNGVIGLAGGLYGNYREYMDAKEHEEQVAKYLNGRVKDPKFKALYDNMKKQEDYDKWLQEQLELGDKSEYKDLELEKFFQDINAAASSGHLEEFKQLVKYNTEYTDDELEDIVKQTSKKITAEEQKKQDQDRAAYLQGAIQESKARYEDTLVEDYTKELEEINQRLAEDDYQDKLEGPFIDVNGQMNVTNPAKMREILERNRQNILQGIDDYLKIRNDIDIETDGRLEDKDIELLTQMKGHILDYEKRSAEMADDLLNYLPGILDEQEGWQKKIKDELNVAQKEYDTAKEHWEKVKNGKHNQEYKDQVEKEFLAAEKKLNKAKGANNSVGNVIKLLEMLMEEKPTNASERVAEAEGYGSGFFDRLASRFDTGRKRRINSDEAQAILANPHNALTLVSIIYSKTSKLDDTIRKRLSQEVADLSVLANKKVAYNNKVREALGDSSKLNEAYQQAEDKISQEEKDNKSDELSLNIKDARSMVELDKIMRDAYNVNPEIAQAALAKAKQTADENTKKLIADYEEAVKFYNDFIQQAQKLPQEKDGVLVASGVVNQAVDVWQEVLQDGVNVLNRFIDGLNEAAELLDRDSTPTSKITAEGIRKVLSDLNVAKSSVATNKNVKNSDKENKEGKKNGEEKGDVKEQGFADLAKKLAEKRAKKQGKQEDKEEERPQEDTKNTLFDAVLQEVKNSKRDDGSYAIDKITSLSKDLQDRIAKYNEENPDNQFNVNFEAIIQNFTNADIADDSTNLGNDDLSSDGTDLGEDTEGSERADRMHETLRVSFKSDHPTEFRIYDGKVVLDYRVPYEPDTEQLKAVQKILQACKAYQFVDNNYLGYVARAMAAKDKSVTIHLLRSTDETVSKDKTNPITFLAIEYTDEVEKAIRKYGFNGNNSANFAKKVSPVHINGKRYHIVGVMSLDSGVDEKVSAAFTSLQGALNKELNPQIEEARANGQPFVVSNLTTSVTSINTGRLDKRNNEDDEGNKVGLYTFMTSQQGDESRGVSSEWDNGMEFYFGTIINGFLNAVDDDKVQEQIEAPNDAWMSKNNGAIVMFVPKPDGRLYPVRVTRRTVSEWLASGQDGYIGKTGRDLLDLVIADSSHNEYLGNIINYLKTIYDEDSTISDKMRAKTMLQKYFIFGKQSPIHFDGGDVVLNLDGNVYELTSDTFEEFVLKFFRALSSRDVKFSIPSPSIENISGREIVKSGVLEVGLRGFYNFNANFTILPIDGVGNPVVIETSTLDDDHFTGGNNNRAQEVKFNLGDGLKTYTIESDGTVTLNGNPVSQDKQNLVTLAMQAEQGNLPEYKAKILGQKYATAPDVKKYIFDKIKGFDGIYIIETDNGDWVYDSRKVNHDERLYSLDSPKGKDLQIAFNQAITDFVSKDENRLAIMKMQKANKNNPPSGNNNPPSVSGTIMVPTAVGQLVPVPAVYVQELRDILDKEAIEDMPALAINIYNSRNDKNTFGGMSPMQVAQALKSLNEAKYDRKVKAFIEGLIESAKRNTHNEQDPEYLQEGYWDVSKGSNQGTSSKSNTGNQGDTPSTRFVGKTLDDLNAKDGGLVELLVSNKKSPVVKKVFAAIQSAEEAGISIDDNKVMSGIKAVLEASKEDKRSMLNDLINDISGCNK